jgi:hypothetical protein
VHDSINHFLADPAYAQVAVLATSRIVGYHPTGLLAELPRLTISPLLDEDVERLLTAWFRQTSADNPDRLVDRMRRRLAQDARMAELATNPLLLTVLALLLARNRELPNEHAQLYAAATETLLYSWPVEQRGSGLSFDTVPRWLTPLARRVFLSPRTHGVPEEEVIELLTASWQEQFGGPPGTAREQTRALLHQVRDDTGLVSVTGRNEDGMRLWDFLHRSFAEYLVARALAEDHLDRSADPLERAHDEAWHEVILMMAGEVGRRRADAVGAIVLRLAALSSTPWEGALHRDLRLALEVLARDVPCGESAVSAIVDAALEAWVQTDITPLREDLARQLASLADTRHAALLANRVTALGLAPAQRLALARWLPERLGRPILESLLDSDEAIADQAAVALVGADMEGRPPPRAVERLLRRLDVLERRTAVSALEVLERHRADDAVSALLRLAQGEDPETSELALRALARCQSPQALAAMEQVLAIERAYELRPVIDRLAEGGPDVQRRMEVRAREGGRGRFEALRVLARMDPASAKAVAADLAASNDFVVQRRALQALDDAAGERALALQALGEPHHAARVWAASVLIRDEEYADEALQTLLEIADDATAGDRLEALSTLTTFAPEEAAQGLADVLETITDPEGRHEALYWLSEETLGYGGEDVLATLIEDQDEWVAFTAAEKLAQHGDQRGFKALVDMVVAGGDQAGRGLRTLMREAREAHLADAQRLLRGKSPAERRLGARLLAACDAPDAVDVASGLLDDPDATVRCAGLWLLARRGRADELLPRVDQLLGDVATIEGPPLDDPRNMLWAERARPVRCCADVVYRWFAEQPAMLESATAGHERGAVVS